MINYVFTEALSVVLGLSCFVILIAVIDFVMTLFGWGVEDGR